MSITDADPEAAHCAAQTALAECRATIASAFRDLNAKAHLGPLALREPQERHRRAEEALGVLQAEERELRAARDSWQAQGERARAAAARAHRLRLRTELLALLHAAAVKAEEGIAADRAARIGPGEPRFVHAAEAITPARAAAERIEAGAA